MDGQCQAARLPAYKLLKPAVHGTVCYRDERLAIRFAVHPGHRSCVGREALSRVVYFRPTGAYVGTDAFQYAIGPNFNESPFAIADVTVTLAPPRSPPQESGSQAAAGAAQQPGPMDRCAELTM